MNKSRVAIEGIFRSIDSPGTAHCDHVFCPCEQVNDIARSQRIQVAPRFLEKDGSHRFKMFPRAQCRHGAIMQIDDIPRTCFTIKVVLNNRACGLVMACDAFP